MRPLVQVQPGPQNQPLTSPNARRSASRCQSSRMHPSGDEVYQCHLVEILRNPYEQRFHPPLRVLPSGAMGCIAVAERASLGDGRCGQLQEVSVGSGGTGAIGLWLLLPELLGSNLYRTTGVSDPYSGRLLGT